ncbi:MAG: DUF3160 domain-containing protein, partial [Bradymonadaceae bacterium]
AATIHWQMGDAYLQLGEFEQAFTHYRHMVEAYARMGRKRLVADTLSKVDVGGRTALTVWRSIDGVVGSFMGKPVDATISHLIEARQEQPEIFDTFHVEKVRDALEKLRGPMLIRDVEAAFAQRAGAGDGTRILNVTFLPKRVGLDTTFFRKLTWPDAGERPFPSALDAMAVLGSKNAYQYVTAAQDEHWAKEYRVALDALIAESLGKEKDPGYWSTDIYHSWLAVLATLANSHEVDDASLMKFANSEAWKDRKLFSAVAGYTQLKHSAVLYNAQDMSAECGGQMTFYALVEQPILPRPHGFVDPVPAFFDGLAVLADEVYTKLYGDKEGPLLWWYSSRDKINARKLAAELATIARHQIGGEALTDEQLELIEFTGAALESMTLGIMGGDSIQLQGQGRAQRGVALATDIHTNLERGQVLQVAVGSVMDLYVAVPDGIAQTMTQGGIFSFYEFTHPMSDRLTDENWAKLMSSDDAPALPTWTKSFVEAGR